MSLSMGLSDSMSRITSSMAAAWSGVSLHGNAISNSPNILSLGENLNPFSSFLSA